MLLFKGRPVYSYWRRLFPEQIIRLFMDVTPEVLLAAQGIIRPFFTLFLFWGITVLATYNLQSIM